MSYKYLLSEIDPGTLQRLKQKQPILFRYMDYLVKTIPSLLIEVNIDQYELELVVRQEDIRPVLYFLKNHTNAQYDILTDMVGADFPAREDRFQVTYLLLSTYYSSRIRVVTYTDEMTPLETVTDIYPVADWLEREVYDLYGVYFEGHPDLRRILTDYGFEGHPLRKDFPLTGYYEIHYDDNEKRIVKSKVSLAQEYRNFKFNNPWDDSTD